MPTLIPILISVIGISCVSFVGALTIGIQRKKLEKYMMILVAFAAGTLIGGALLHLLPEAFESIDPTQASFLMLIAFAVFFLLERVVHWRHCHTTGCTVHSFGAMSLIGDGLHNFLDGLTIAAAYSVSFEVGLAATVAVIMHEIPQELGDFVVLLKAGYTMKSALLWNFVSAAIAIVGGLIGYFLAQNTEQFAAYLLPLAAGGFLYVGATDLLPELQRDTTTRASLKHIIPFLLGLGFMYLMLYVH